jgi:hypothetical protein
MTPRTAAWHATLRVAAVTAAASSLVLNGLFNPSSSSLLAPAANGGDADAMAKRKPL